MMPGRLERQITARLVSLTLRTALGLIIALATVLATGAAVLEWLIDPAFDNLGQALWFSVTTVTTVGYGDYVPESDGGRVVAAALMLAGVSLIPLITSIVVSIMVAQRTREERESDLRQLDTILERLERHRPQTRRHRPAFPGAGNHPMGVRTPDGGDPRLHDANGPTVRRPTRWCLRAITRSSACCGR